MSDNESVKAQAEKLAAVPAATQRSALFLFAARLGDYGPEAQRDADQIMFDLGAPPLDPDERDEDRRLLYGLRALLHA